MRTPRTLAAHGQDALIRAAARLDAPFITKHNRAGKGLGVKLFHDHDAFHAYLASDQFEPSVDGVTLLQQYIESPGAYITRVEFIGGRFQYAVRVDTSDGFELCPADACSVDDAFCPVGDAATERKFEIIRGFEHPLVRRYEALLASHGVGVAAFEFIVDAAGRDYTYDINTNTNYNASAEQRAGMNAMGALADFLGRALRACDAHGRIAA